jgi:hypothetical protein
MTWEEGKMRISKRAMLVVLGAVVTLTAALMTGIAWAVFPDDNVTHFTGCLNTAGGASGTFSQVAVGDAPTRSCGSNQTIAHLSGGDITSISAGSGLTGGGIEGAVSLAVDSSQVQTRVFDDCSGNPGEAIKQINQDGSVSCSAGPSARIVHFADGGSVPDDPETIGSLPLPAGKFLLIAKVFVEQEEPTSLAPTVNIVCRLNGDFQTNGVFTAPTSVWLPGSTITMIGSEVLAAPGTANVECYDGGGSAADADGEWRFLTITAIKLDDLGP